jgi:hypothetical protein
VGFCRTTYAVMLAPAFEIERAREFKKKLPIGKGRRSYSANLCGNWVATFVEKLQNFRGEFAIAYPGANFHLWPDIANRPNQIAFGVSRNAVTAAQRGIGSEHA